MKLSKTLVYLLILILSAAKVYAQTSGSNCICPVITVSEPDRILQPGEPAAFTAEVKGDKGQTTYNWTVSAGTIISGQGTKTISVDTKDLPGASVTATVTVGGWCPTCENLSASGTSLFIEKLPAHLFDRLNNPNCEYRQAIMDGYFAELSNDPTATGHIFTFGSPRTVAEVERKIRANINWRKFPPDRFVFTNGGGKSKEPVIEFWVVPAGADIPTPKPPVENPADFDTPETTVKRNPKEPYIFSAEYYDGGACIDENRELDLAGYAKFLKENPGRRGKIVILMMTTSEFRKKEREILSFLAKRGIARQRIKTFHQKTFGGVELWILP